MTAINTLKAHLAINVRDVEKSIEFYRGLFGIDPSKVRIGYAKFDVSNPPLNLTLDEAFVDRLAATLTALIDAELAARSARAS